MSYFKFNIRFNRNLNNLITYENLTKKYFKQFRNFKI